MLATSTGELPAGATSLEELLSPPPPTAWTQRHGVEQLRLLGEWLRRLHDTAPTGVSAPAAIVPDTADLLGAGSWRELGVLEEVHAASLRLWSALLLGGGRLADGRLGHGRLGHGRLGLDRVFPHTPSRVEFLVVDATGGLTTLHPAIDVGWVTADLLELIHRARALGEDPAPFGRLLSAFSAGYRGAWHGPGPDDLDVFRAAAMRLALHAPHRTTNEIRTLDLKLARHLVEHCWQIGGADRAPSPPPDGDGAGR